MDLELAGLQNKIEIGTEKGERTDRQLPAEKAARAGCERDAAHPLELQHRTGDARHRIVHEQEQRRFAGEGALILHRHRHLDGFTSGDHTGSAAQIAQREAAVRQTVTEWKLRRRRNIQVRAAQALTGLERAAGRTLAKENRHLAAMTGPGYRQSARGIELPGEDISDRVT